MKLGQYEQDAITQDIEEHGLRKGDIGVLIDSVPHPKGGEEGCLLEVFNALSESIAVVSVRLSEIEPVRADEVLAVRQLTKAG
jgi:hypothetical protein